MSSLLGPGVRLPSQLPGLMHSASVRPQRFDTLLKTSKTIVMWTLPQHGLVIGFGIRFSMTTRPWKSGTSVPLMQTTRILTSLIQLAMVTAETLILATETLESLAHGSKQGQVV